MFRSLPSYLPQLEDWEVHWLLPNLRFDAVYNGGGPGLTLAVRIINDGYEDSTSCAVLARVVEIERSNDPNTPMIIRYRFDDRVKRLRALKPGDTEQIDFGPFLNSYGNTEMFACLVIDPATDAYPFGQVREIDKRDNTFCQWYEIFGPVPQEDAPSEPEKTLEAPGCDPSPYRLYLRIAPDKAE